MQTDLASHLSGTGTPIAEFAKRIGVEPQTVYRYLAGERMPRPKIMRRIVEATDGRVTADSFLRADQKAA